MLKKINFFNIFLAFSLCISLPLQAAETNSFDTAQKRGRLSYWPIFVGAVGLGFAYIGYRLGKNKKTSRINQQTPIASQNSSSQARPNEFVYLGFRFILRNHLPKTDFDLVGIDQKMSYEDKLNQLNLFKSLRQAGAL
jgi:hypothetical protein